MNSQTQSGFTLLETMVSVTLFVIIMIMSTSVYNTMQASYRSGADRAESTQNARVAIDRMSRELRQSMGMAGDFNLTKDTATSSLQFQDGHNQSQITYIRYYLDGTNLMRQTLFYYFSGTPSTYVYYDTLGLGGVLPTASTTESNIIAEYVKDLKFWGDDTEINFLLTVLKNKSKFSIETIVSRRN